jgi:hypothetical protein
VLGILLGAAAVGFGRVVPLPSLSTTAIVGLLALAAAGLDAGRVASKGLIRRQVNEDWLGRYRGWVYGSTFGFQLGAGLFTTTTWTFVCFVLTAVASSSFSVALVAGLAYGAVRGMSVFIVRDAVTAQRLTHIDGWLEAASGRMRSMVVSLEFGVGLTALFRVMSSR